MQKVILVVEHDPLLRGTITRLLRREGYLVLTAADGATAIDVARHNPISLIIFDPESLQPGWPDLCRQLHTFDETAQMPILMIGTSEAEITQMVRLGPRANDFIVKPFVWQEFCVRVRALLQGSKRRQKVILVVEQDAVLRETIIRSLRGEGYLVFAVTDDEVAIDIARTRPISLIILDSTSPQKGIALSRQLRECDKAAHVPILMMATSEMAMLQMARLDSRVNDFIVKPFLWEELRACVRALLRGDIRRVRQKLSAASPRKEMTPAGGQVLIADTLCIDLDQRRVTREGQQIKLGSRLLFDLLVYLVRNRGAVLTRDQLLQDIWSREVAQDTRTVDVHVHWLRQKLYDNSEDPQLIQTVPGMGYRFKG